MVSRIMVQWRDPQGKPRAWGIASELSTAAAEADRQLWRYRQKKAEVGDSDLAMATYSMHVVTFVQDGGSEPGSKGGVE